MLTDRKKKLLTAIIREYIKIAEPIGSVVIVKNPQFKVSSATIRNEMLDGVEGGYALYLPSNETLPVYEAAMRYVARGTPLLVIAGKDYGSGSSRDWAAKGTLLLGVRAVIAESFERIHRSNLVQFGVLPLEFEPGENRDSLGLTGFELYDVDGLTDDITPRKQLTVRASGPAGMTVSFNVTARLDTPVDCIYYQNGGVLHTVFRRWLNEAKESGGSHGISR